MGHSDRLSRCQLVDGKKAPLRRTLVIIPTLNEEQSITDLLKDLETINVGFDVLIVDDDSHDNTAANVSLFAKSSKRAVTLLSRKSPTDGLAGAYVTGYTWATINHYNFIVQMDADGQHRPKDIPLIIEKLISGNPVVVGSRYCKGGRIEGWSRWRVLISQIGNLYFRMLFKPGVKDATGGYKGFEAASLKLIWDTPPTSRGFTFHAETTLRARNRKLLIREVPITFVSRTKGDSKMSLKSGLESIFLMTRWRLRRKDI